MEDVHQDRRAFAFVGKLLQRRDLPVKLFDLEH